MMRKPSLVINTDEFLRAVLFDKEPVNVHQFCHRPVIENNTRVLLGKVLSQLMATGDVMEYSVVLVWAEQRRVITGSDILERLLRGVATIKARRCSSLKCYAE